MLRIVKETPPGDQLVECPITKPQAWMLQHASVCGTINDGMPCQFYGGLVDGADQMIEQLKLQAISQGMSETEALAQVQQTIVQMTFDQRYRIHCSFPKFRRMRPIAGQGE